MKRFLPLILLVQVFVSGYEFELPDESSGCAISINLSLSPVAPGDLSGRAVIEVKINNKSGTPIVGRSFELTASRGTFLCRLPGDSSETDSTQSRSCFVTGQDGKGRVHLVNVPFNSPVNVKAISDCGDYTVSATGNLSIKQIKK